MVTHQNPSISDAALRILNTKMGNSLSDEVSGPVAVIAIEPVCRIVRRITTTGASGTIYQTPTDKDFYLTAAYLTRVKDVASTDSTDLIRITVDGVAREVMAIAGITLTADSQSLSSSFDPPIKVDRNIAITLVTSAAGATMSVTGGIIGYTQEVVRT